jgi:hypothetical protein
MRVLFILPLICALMSLLAIFGLSATTILPRSGAESFRGHMIFAAGAFCVAWLCLAFWLQARQRQASLSQWFRRFLVVVSIFYVLAVFVFVIG